MEKGKDIKIGCCGFAASQQEYFSRFMLIEIQNTFYQLPRLQTAEKWRNAAPAGFEFTMKAWQLITHEPSSPTYRRLKDRIAPEKWDRYGRFRATPEVLEGWRKTAMFAEALGASWVVFQCPASFRPTKQNADQMRRFFNTIDRGDFQFAWEPRGKWPETLIFQLCEELALIHCVDPFKNRVLYGDFHYFRLHGVTGYNHRYTGSELKMVEAWVGNKPTYVLFNNNAMKEDALRFKVQVEGGKGKTPSGL
jgi:uncharacterized protein YecE (DUF72 family)